MTFSKGQKPWNKGMEMPLKTRLKISASKKGSHNAKASETKRKLYAEGKLVPWNKGKHHMQGKDHPLYGKPRPEATRKKISEGLERWYKFNKFIPWNKGKTGIYSEKSNLIRSIKSKQLWKNEIYRTKVIANSLNGLFKRPTSLERKLIEVIERNSLPFRYCGNGSELIGGFNPDFIAIDGRNLLIETANRFHHQEGYEKQRYAIFAKYGYRTLFLWWDDFFTDKYGKKTKKNWEQTILEKVKQFSFEP